MNPVCASVLSACSTTSRTEPTSAATSSWIYSGTRAGRLLDERLCTTCAVHEQSGDASDDRVQRQIVHHLLVCARARRKNDPRWLLDQRIRRAEHSSRTVLPDPRMDHPTRLARELAALGTALCLCHVGSRTVVGQHAHIVMFVPAGERPREQRFDGCPSAPAGATSKYLTPTSRIPFGAVASRSYRRIGGSVTEKVVLSAWRT